MNQQYGRIENMMFIRVIKSDVEGNPEVDPVTGEQIVENDGC
jgi:hypothetical protein